MLIWTALFAKSNFIWRVWIICKKIDVLDHPLCSSLVYADMDRPLWKKQLPLESLDFLQKIDRLDCPFCKSLVHGPAPQKTPFFN